MNKTSSRILLIVILVVAIGALIAAISLRPEPKLPKAVTIDTANQPVMGNPNAKVHIVAFEDLKCVNCKRFNVELFPKIKKSYIDTGIANYTMINLAFIPGSLPAANAARCLYSQNKKFFFPFVKYVYKHQPPEDQNWATIPTLLNFIDQLNLKGVNKNKLTQCMIDGRYDNVINNNLNLATKVMGSTVATPSIYINGRIADPLTMPQIELLIEAARKDKAKN